MKGHSFDFTLNLVHCKCQRRIQRSLKKAPTQPENCFEVQARKSQAMSQETIIQSLDKRDGNPRGRGQAIRQGFAVGEGTGTVPARLAPWIRRTRILGEMSCRFLACSCPGRARSVLVPGLGTEEKSHKNDQQSGQSDLKTKVKEVHVSGCRASKEGEACGLHAWQSECCRLLSGAA